MFIDVEEFEVLGFFGNPLHKQINLHLVVRGEGCLFILSFDEVLCLMDVDIFLEIFLFNHKSKFVL